MLKPRDLLEQDIWLRLLGNSRSECENVTHRPMCLDLGAQLMVLLKVVEHLAGEALLEEVGHSL